MHFPCSVFSDIFDVDWFIKYLANDVSVVKELPLRKGQIWLPYRMRVPRKCSDSCYIHRVLPVLKKKHVSISSPLYCIHEDKTILFVKCITRVVETNMFMPYIRCLNVDIYRPV